MREKRLLTLLGDKIIWVDPLNLGHAVHTLLFALLLVEVVSIDRSRAREARHREPKLAVLPPPGDLVDRPDEAFGKAFDALPRLEVVEVQFVFDVDRVEEDQGVVVGDVDGGQERVGFVGDEVSEALRNTRRLSDVDEVGGGRERSSPSPGARGRTLRSCSWGYRWRSCRSRRVGRRCRYPQSTLPIH
jgi:hypothetical protein